MNPRLEIWDDSMKSYSRKFAVIGLVLASVAWIVIVVHVCAMSRNLPGGVECSLYIVFLFLLSVGGTLLGWILGRVVDAIRMRAGGHLDSQLSSFWAQGEEDRLESLKAERRNELARLRTRCKNANESDSKKAIIREILNVKKRYRKLFASTKRSVY